MINLQGNSIALNDFRVKVVKDVFKDVAINNSNIIISNDSLTYETLSILNNAMMIYNPDLNTISFKDINQSIFINDNAKVTLVTRDKFIELLKPNDFYIKLMDES